MQWPICSRRSTGEEPARPSAGVQGALHHLSSDDSVPVADAVARRGVAQNSRARVNYAGFSRWLHLPRPFGYTF